MLLLILLLALFEGTSACYLVGSYLVISSGLLHIDQFSTLGFATLTVPEMYTLNESECDATTFIVVAHTAEIDGTIFFPDPLSQVVELTLSREVTYTYYFPGVTLTSLTYGPEITLYENGQGRGIWTPGTETITVPVLATATPIPFPSPVGPTPSTGLTGGAIVGIVVGCLVVLLLLLVLIYLCRRRKPSPTVIVIHMEPLAPPTFPNQGFSKKRQTDSNPKWIEGDRQSGKMGPQFRRETRYSWW